jgi:hypothetical protein
MKLFENSGVTILLQYVKCKSEGMAMAVTIFPCICAMSCLVCPSVPQKWHH